MKSWYTVFSVAILLLSLVLAGCAGPEAQKQGKEERRAFGREIVRSVDFECVDFDCPDFNCPGKKCTFKDKTLMKIVGFKRGDYVDLIIADNSRRNLEEFYWKKGFRFAEVKLDSEKISETEVGYKYTISGGPRIVIGKVKFHHDNKVKTGKLRKAVRINKKRWFLWSRYYNEEQLQADLDGLDYIYSQERGFLDRQIRVELDPNIVDPNLRPAELKPVTKVEVKFVIKEEEEYIIRKIIVVGAEKIYKIDSAGRFDEESVRTMLKSKEGRAYSELRAQSDAEQLRRLYRESGFPDAEVAHTLYRDNGFLEFKITEKEQFRIGRIEITGNKQTQDKVIRRILDGYEFQPGRAYNFDIAPVEGGGKLEQEILRRLLVADANILALGAGAGQKDVEVNIREGPTGHWSPGFGWSTDRGLIGQMIYEQRNFNISDWPRNFLEAIALKSPSRGAGQHLRIQLMPGTEVSEYMINFTEPYFQDKPIQLDVSSSSSEWERESYYENRVRGYVEFAERYEQRYKDLWRRSIAFRGGNIDVARVDLDAPKEIKEVEGDNIFAGIKLGMGKDLTDDRYNPSAGYRLNGDYEQVGGDHTFGILSGTCKGYFTIHEDVKERKTILATKIHGATVIGEAPAFEKFYAGGTGAYYGIRGFEYRGVSTRGIPEVDGVPVAGAEKKDPIGSDWIFLANAEVIMPLVSETLSALFFVDSGMIDSGGYRAAAGIGVQILIPQWFGPVPMRFEVAAPMMKDDADDTQVFSFSVGRLF